MGKAGTEGERKSEFHSLYGEIFLALDFFATVYISA